MSREQALLHQPPRAVAGAQGSDSMRHPQQKEHLGAIAAPFLKWAGGKRQLLAQLGALAPVDFRGYIEPFVGGGAMFFHLWNLGRVIHHAVLSDVNAELMNCYRVIKDAVQLDALIHSLSRYATKTMNPEYYYDVRSWDRDPRYTELRSQVERAARTIFLNHTCFNGLFRMNSRGQFNVPYGRWWKPPTVFSEAVLWACQYALRSVALHETAYQSCAQCAEAGDFVYLDPPYVPLSPTASFTCYSGTPFGQDDHRRLAALAGELADRGCMVMASNSDTPLVRKLYEKWRLVQIPARRNINSKAAGRGFIDELVALSY